MRVKKKRITLFVMIMMLLSVMVIPAYAKVITYTANSTTNSTTAASSKNKESYGPGYTAQDEDVEIEEETASFQGPTVKKVSLSETYHELYDTYEESIADIFFLYTNVSNGSLTHEPVAIDIPANVTYTMEKDGRPYPYVTGYSVTEKGTYVLRLTAIENQDLPFSEQTEYQAVFRFRIQDAPPETEAAVSGNSYTGTNETMVDISVLLTDESKPAETETAAAEMTTEASVEASEVTTQETTVEETTCETTAETESEAENESVVETAEAANTEAVANRVQTYDPETGYYTIVLENGMQLFLSVEDGYKGEGPVQFAVADEDLAMTALYRGSERVTLTKSSRTITENGKYTLAMADDAGNIASVNFTIPYQMNFYAVLAIVLCALVVVGIVVFVVLTKKNFKVR